MNLTGRFEKWGVGVLGAVSLALVVNLVVQYNKMRAEGKRLAVKPPAVMTLGAKLPGVKRVPQAKVNAASAAKAGAGKQAGKQGGKQKIQDELSRYDSIVEVDRLKEFEDRPLPELDRNPFAFVAGPALAPRAQAPGAAPQPAQPPPPPPVTLKVMGYSEGAGGADEAMVTDEDQVLVVHAGDSVGTRYKIIKITSTAVTVEDNTSHQTVDLPVPQ
jgi:Tfp pilus assembly protein PilP